MKIKTLITSFLILSLTSLTANACPPLKYSPRGDRDEGIVSRINISGSLRLVSLVSNGTETLGDYLTIKIPGDCNSSQQPEVTIRAIEERYRLDKLQLTCSQGYYTFRWSTEILKCADISVKHLRATATIGQQLTYIPVIIGQPANRYEIALYSYYPARLPIIKIISPKKEVVYNNSTTEVRRGEFIFPWDGKKASEGKASEGRYELHYVAEIHVVGEPVRTIERQIHFKHDPNWLR